MSAMLISLLAGLAATLQTRTSLQVEILALRHLSLAIMRAMLIPLTFRAVCIDILDFGQRVAVTGKSGS